MNPITTLTDTNFEKGRDYIGASDAPVLAGLMKQYRTPVDKYLEMIGEAEPFEGNERTKWGHIQENNILAEYVATVGGFFDDFMASRFSGKVIYEEDNKRFLSLTEARHPDNPRFVAHADLLVMHSNKNHYLVQAKNAGIYAAKRGDDPLKGYDPDDHTANGVPYSVFLQEQWELYCYGLTTAYVAVLIDGWDWQLYGPIYYQRGVVEKLKALAERMLWHVDNRTAPTPQTWPDVVKLFPEFNKSKIQTVDGKAEAECLAALNRYKKITADEKKLKAEKEDIRNAIGVYLQGDGRLETAAGDKIATAFETTRKSIDLKRLEKEDEELYNKVMNEYGKTTNSRTLRI